MPRKPRLEIAGAAFHVCAQGVNKQSIFRDDEDRLLYLRLLAQVVKTYEWRLLSYNLLGNHIHLLIVTVLPNLGAGMGLLHGTYARRFRERHDERGFGHLFQDRFVSAPARDEGWLWRDIAYVALNPVKHDFCVRPEDWEWSSHTAIVRGQQPSWVDTERLFGYFEIDGGDGRANYLEWVERQLVNLKTGGLSPRL
jgi:REP-associated tyrosine transposase